MLPHFSFIRKIPSRNWEYREKYSTVWPNSIIIHDRTQFKTKHTICILSCGLFLTCRGKNRFHHYLHSHYSIERHSFFNTWQARSYSLLESRGMWWVEERCSPFRSHAPSYWCHWPNSHQLNIYRCLHHFLPRESALLAV
jgi:hypothetical protein